MKVTYVMVFLNRLANLKKAVRHHAPHVDRTIIVDGGSTDGSIEWLTSDECKAMNVEVVHHAWRDNPPDSRNRYLKEAGHEGWILALDDDEYLEEPAIWSIKQIAEQAERDGASALAFNSHDIQTNEKGEVWEHKSDYWNPLVLFKAGPRVVYHGATHVGLQYQPGKIMKTSWRYYHIKTSMEQWIRGARNYWTTAAPASNTVDDKWKHFKSICKKYELTYFFEMAKLMQDGTVPKELEDWMIDNKDSDNSEVRSFFVSYFIFQHPEKNPGLSNRDYTFQSNRPVFKELFF